MSTAESQPTGFEVVVDEDGGISAEALARYGLNHPGMHLRLVAHQGKTNSGHKTALGILKGKIDVDAIEDGIRQTKADRVADTE